MISSHGVGVRRLTKSNSGKNQSIDYAFLKLTSLWQSMSHRSACSGAQRALIQPHNHSDRKPLVLIKIVPMPCLNCLWKNQTSNTFGISPPHSRKVHENRHDWRLLIPDAIVPWMEIKHSFQTWFRMVNWIYFDVGDELTVKETKIKRQGPFAGRQGHLAVVVNDDYHEVLRLSNRCRAQRP